MKFYNPWTDSLEEDTQANLEKCAARAFAATIACIPPYSADSNEDDTLEEWASSLEFIRQLSEIDVFEINEVIDGKRVTLTFRDETQPYGWPEIDA